MSLSTRMHREDRGVAMVMALLVVFVVLMLSIVVISQSIHNTTQSGYDRNRLTAVNAAEAGLDCFFNYLEKTAAAELWMDPAQNPGAPAPPAGATCRQGTMGSAPGSVTFAVTPTYYSDEGEIPFDWETLSSSKVPLSVMIRSVGTAGSATRTMQAFMILSPVYGGFNGALIANPGATSTTTFSNNFTINGNAGNDGDVMILSGNFSAPSGLAAIKGSIYVPAGTASISTNVRIYGSVWANGSVTVNHSQTQVDGDVKSSTAGTTVSSGTVLGSAYYCTGSAPGSNVQGSKINTCSLGAPPSQAFPQVTYVASAWAASGYQEKVYTGASACTDAKSYIEGTGSGQFNGGAGVPSQYTGVVVRIQNTCSYTTTNNWSVTMSKDLAIVTDGGISLSQQSTWNGSGGQRDLHFISAYPTVGSPSCPTQDVTLQNNTNFNTIPGSQVEVFVYSPCTVTMNNNNTAFTGQVVGATLSIGNNFSMSYRPVYVPGANVTSFTQDIAYIREVRN